MSDVNTQDEPVERGSDDASRDEKIRGIVEQVRADVALGHSDDAEALLRQRLRDAGIPTNDLDLSRHLL